MRALLRALLLACAVATTPLAAQMPPSLTMAHAPFRVIGNVYYVGTADLASYLIATPQGLILINSDLESSVPQIQQNIEALGFHFRDVKILLISHAHFDHCAGSALIKKLTGATYMVMDADVPVIESGGRADFNYGGDSTFAFPPAKVDRVLHDGDEVRLGKVVLVAHLTAGHTKGCTTWTMNVTDGGRVYHVVIVGGPYVNTGYQLVRNAKYPTIAQDYARGFSTLKSLPCDVFLGAHGGYFDMEAKFARLTAGQTGPNPFIDQAGYTAFVADREQDFRTELAKQSSGLQ